MPWRLLNSFYVIGGGGSGGGNTSADNEAPVAVINFPTATALTEGKTVIVRGTATDDSGVADILVNGINATTTNNYANWWVEIPLVRGLNTLPVTTLDNQGNREDLPAQLKITSNALLLSPQGLALDSTNNRVLVTDGVCLPSSRSISQPVPARLCLITQHRIR